MSRLAIIAELAQRRAIALREEQIARIAAIQAGVRRRKTRQKRAPFHRTGSRRYKYADGVAYAEARKTADRVFAARRRERRKAERLCQKCGVPCDGTFCPTHLAEHKARVHTSRRLKRLQKRVGIRALSRGVCRKLGRRIAKLRRATGKRAEITLCD